MGGFVSKPSAPAPKPVVTPTQAEVQQSSPNTDAQAALVNKQKGRSSTILTGTTGANSLGENNVQRKTLLGA